MKKSFSIYFVSMVLATHFSLLGSSIAMDILEGEEQFEAVPAPSPQEQITNLLNEVAKDLKGILGEDKTGIALSWLMAPPQYGIYGPEGKITRDNIRNIFSNSQRPLRDQDIAVLKNLRNAINDQETRIYGRVMSSAIPKEAKEAIVGNLDRILSIMEQNQPDNIVQMHMNPQLVLRQATQKINDILIRNDNLGEDPTYKGVGRLDYLLGLNPGCATKLRKDPEWSKRREAIRQTLSKSSGAMGQFNQQDIDNLKILRDAVTIAQPVCVTGAVSRVQTQPLQEGEKIVEEFDRIAYILDNPAANRIKAVDDIYEVLSVSDLPFLRQCQKIDIDMKDTLKRIETRLNESLLVPDAIPFLPIYKAKGALIKRHHQILEKVMLSQNIMGDHQLLRDLFIELTQLKMALESFSEVPFKPTSAGKARAAIAEKLYLKYWDDIDWQTVRASIFGHNGIIADIQYMRQLILCELSHDGDIQNKIMSLEQKKKLNDNKIVALQNKDDIWILSLAGGGIRGKIAAQILKDLQDKGVNVLQRFDYFAGTSVGGLIVTSLNVPKPRTPKNGEFDATFVAGLLEGETAKLIFPPLEWKRKLAYQGNSYAYNEYALENLLTSNYHYILMSDLVKPTLVVAVDQQTGRTIYLKSYGMESQDIYAWQAARATSAAPTYFPPMALFYNGQTLLLEDGGMTENDPTYIALSEVARLCKEAGRKPQRINIVSIGTGKINPQQQFGGGGIGVSLGVLEKPMEENAKKTREQALLKQENLIQNGIVVNYYILNPELTEAIELDNSEEPNLAKLRNAAADIMGNPYYQHLVGLLTGTEQDDDRSKVVEIWGPGENQIRVENRD